MQSGNSVYKDGVLSVAVLAAFDSLFPKKKDPPNFKASYLNLAKPKKKSISIYKQFYIKPWFLSFFVITQISKGGGKKKSVYSGTSVVSSPGLKLPSRIS